MGVECNVAVETGTPAACPYNLVVLRGSVAI
jgi:hypothetical protein